jgi:hypothetical protein
MGSRSMRGSTLLSSSICLAAAVCLAASRQRPPSMGSRAGSRRTVRKVVATVVVGGRLYLFIPSHMRSDARAFFDAFVATIDLRPEDAAMPSISPSSWSTIMPAEPASGRLRGFRRRSCQGHAVVALRQSPAGSSIPSRIPRRQGRARMEDLLTGRPTLAVSCLCHNAQTYPGRKQQVLGSNPIVGSTPLFRAQEEQLSGVSTVLPTDEALLTDEDLLTGRATTA